MNRILIAFVVYLLLRGRFETYAGLATTPNAGSGGQSSNVANKGDFGKTGMEAFVDLIPQIPGVIELQTTKDIEQKALK